MVVIHELPSIKFPTLKKLGGERCLSSIEKSYLPVQDVSDDGHLHLKTASRVVPIRGVHEMTKGRVELKGSHSWRILSTKPYTAAITITYESSPLGLP